MKFQQAMECGGAYVKLLSQQDSFDLVRTQIAMSAQIMSQNIHRCPTQATFHLGLRNQTE